MPSKTPKFDEALGEILNNLQPHKRKCRECNGEFEIMTDDIDFYKKLQVPPPTLCPQCRMQRRMSHRVILPIFYRKTCSAPGHSEKVISFYSEKNPVKIYDDKYFISNEWTASDFTWDYDAEKSFFEQFNKFKLSVPHQASSRDLASVGCEYTVSGSNSRNCYYSSAPIESENVNYSVITINTKDSMDVADVDNSQVCYDSVYLNHCYNVKYSLESSDCVDSAFLYNCKNCTDCFMSANLRHQKYYFKNQKLSKEEYRQKIQEINFGSRKVVKQLKKEFQELLQKAIHKNLNNEKINNSRGNLLRECNNCYEAVRVFGGSENIRYIYNAHQVEDSMDIYGGIVPKRCYECSGLGDGVSELKFSMVIRGGLQLEYCTDCNNCEYCFACVGLKNKKYHIFNKPYSKEEYWQKVDEIKTEMLKKGEYGEFFPTENSLHPYQDTIAGVEYPLSEKEVEAKGWHKYVEVDSDLNLAEMETISGNEIPDNIKEVDESILQKVFICEKTKKPFKIIKPEFDFYKQQNIPLPTKHPLERIKERAKHKYTFKLFKDVCAKCGKEIVSAHDPKKSFIIYCEQCYQDEVV